MVSIKQHSGIYTLRAEQHLPISLYKAWDFFSAPENLSVITPDYMNFTITSGFDEKVMFPGQIITYRVSPFKGIRSNWVTEITQVVKEKYFVDEQRFGPYSLWHHEHHFKEGRKWYFGKR